MCLVSSEKHTHVKGAASYPGNEVGKRRRFDWLEFRHMYVPYWISFLFPFPFSQKLPSKNLHTGFTKRDAHKVNN